MKVAVINFTTLPLNHSFYVLRRTRGNKKAIYQSLLQANHVCRMLSTLPFCYVDGGHSWQLCNFTLNIFFHCLLLLCIASFNGKSLIMFTLRCFSSFFMQGRFLLASPLDLDCTLASARAMCLFSSSIINLMVNLIIYWLLFLFSNTSL